MSWFFIALIAPFLWALVNISDQYLVEKYSSGQRSSGGLVLFSSFIGIFTALFISFFTKDLFNVSHLDKFLLILTGGLTIAWIIFYLFALEIEDVSSVVAWFLTIPIFGYILGFLFLGETLTQNQIWGSLIIFIGLIILSFNFSDGKKIFKFWPTIYMLIACFLVAVSGVIFKFITIEGNFWISSFWEYLGLGFFGILIYFFSPKYRAEFTKMNRDGGKKIFALNTLSEIFTIIGNLLTNYALLLAPVTMVYLVGSFQPAIVLLLTIFATKFYPEIAHENLDKKILFPKIFAIIIMISGSVILFL